MRLDLGNPGLAMWPKTWRAHGYQPDVADRPIWRRTLRPQHGMMYDVAILQCPTARHRVRGRWETVAPPGYCCLYIGTFGYAKYALWCTLAEARRDAAARIRSHRQGTPMADGLMWG